MNLIIRNIIEITYVEHALSFLMESPWKVLVKVLGLATVWIQGVFECFYPIETHEHFFQLKDNLLWLIIFPVDFPGTSYSAMLRLSRVEQSHRYLDITSELQGHFP